MVKMDLGVRFSFPPGSFFTVDVGHEMYFQCYFKSLVTVYVGLQMCFQCYFASLVYVTGIYIYHPRL